MPFRTEFGAHPKNDFLFCRDLLISSLILPAHTIQHYETLPGGKNKMLPDTLIGDHNFERPDRDTDWRPILGLVETYILNQSIG